MKKHSLFTIVSMIMGLVFCSCNSDDVEQMDDGSSNTVDVAVTSNVSKIGITYAQIDGYVNLNQITTTYTTHEMGIELSMTEDFVNSKLVKTREVEGKKITVMIDTLSGNTKYYYRTFVNVNNIKYVGEIRSLSTKDFKNIVSIGEVSDITERSAMIICTGKAGSVEKENKLCIGIAYSTSKDDLHPNSAFFSNRYYNSNLKEFSLDSLINNKSYSTKITLKGGTEYYCCSFTRAGSKYKLGEIKSFKSFSSYAGQLDDGKGNHELPEGYRLSSVGNSFRYYYDELGNMESIYADGESFDFSTKGMTFDDEVQVKVSFNGNGFVSKISGSYETTYDGAKYSASESGSVSYNSNKQITSITGSYKQTGSYEGQKYSETENVSINFTYSGKRLNKVVWKNNYSGPYGKGTETYTYTFDYDNEYENPYGQWTHYLTYCLPESDFFEALAYVGCFGRATSILPDVIYEEEEDVDEDGTSTDKDTYHCSYTFNTYGALLKADGYEYKYTTVTPDDNHVKATRAADESVLKPFVQTEKPRHHRFLRHRRK